jgi:tRNA threonylcarbamoyladenosine biosynthesis protein TsaE
VIICKKIVKLIKKDIKMWYNCYINGDVMKKEIIIKNVQDMITLGEKIGRKLTRNMVITLEGDLGAGKTTFTKGIALGLDIKGIVNSPTFTIMKIYEGRLRLYHLDVYRIDANDFELAEYFENDGVCVIEWANNIKELLPDEVLNINIFDLGNDQRRVELWTNSKEYECIIEEVIA